MSGHSRPDDDRDLDIWVQEVTETWRVPRLRPDQMSWQIRIGRSGSRATFARVSGARVFGALAAAAVVALASVMLVTSLPISPDPGLGGRGTDVAASPSPTGGTKTRGEGSDELFSLTIHADSGRYAAEEPIKIATTLRYIGDEPTTVGSSGGGLVNFSVEQLDGPVDAFAGRDLDCARFEYRPGDVESVEFQKSGGYSNDDPMADFWRAFFADPELRLPPGEYRITASADYHHPGPDCGRQQDVEASIVIIVE